MSNALVFVENNQVLTDSLKVAEYFKNGLHKIVRRDIRKLIEQTKDGYKSVPMFQESTYTDKYGREQPMYLMNRDGFTLLVMGYEGKEAMRFKLKYIEAFNAMEAKLKNQVSKIDPSSVLDPDVIIALATQLKEARAEIKELKPKAEYCDKILQAPDLVPITTIAKDYGMSAVRFNRLLKELGVQYKRGDMWYLYQEYSDKGWTQTKTYSYEDEEGNGRSAVHTYWTQKGRLGLYELLKQFHYLPLIEQEDK